MGKKSNKNNLQKNLKIIVEKYSGQTRESDKETEGESAKTKQHSKSKYDWFTDASKDSPFKLNWRIYHRERGGGTTIKFQSSMNLEDLPFEASSIYSLNQPSLGQLCVDKIARNIDWPNQIEKIRNLPLSLRDLIFFQALHLGTIKKKNWGIFLHPNIEFLDLSNYSSEITDEVVEQLILPNVKSIEDKISNWEDIEDKELQISDMCKGLVNLRYLILTNWNKLSVHSIEQILANCPLLIHLDLSRNNSVNHINISSPNLKSLDLSFTKCSFQLNTPKLVKLKVGYSSILPKQQVNVVNTIRNCLLLETLNLSGWSFWNNGTHLYDLICNLPNLHQLTLKDCEMMDDILVTITNLCPIHVDLTYLNLSGNFITAKGITAVIKRFPNLQTLDISHTGCSSQSDLNSIGEVAKEYNPFANIVL